MLGWVDGWVGADKFCAGTDTISIADIAFLATYSTLRYRSIRASNKGETKVRENFTITEKAPTRAFS